MRGVSDGIMASRRQRCLWSLLDACVPRPRAAVDARGRSATACVLRTSPATPAPTALARAAVVVR